MALLRRRGISGCRSLFCVWANLHGAVLLGAVLLGGGAGRVARSKISSFCPKLAPSSALCLVATLMTPLGWHFWLDMPRRSAHPSAEHRRVGAAVVLSRSGATPVLDRGYRPRRALDAARRALLADPAARREDASLVCACALALLPLALTAVRNVPPFLMLSSAGDRSALCPDLRRHNLKFARASAAECDDSRSSRRHCRRCRRRAYKTRPSRFNSSPLPAPSISALNRCQATSTTATTKAVSDLVRAARQVFLDRRQIPIHLASIKEQLQVEASGDFERLFARYDIRCAFLPAASPVSASLTRAGGHRCTAILAGPYLRETLLMRYLPPRARKRNVAHHRRDHAGSSKSTQTRNRRLVCLASDPRGCRGCSMAASGRGAGCRPAAAGRRPPSGRRPSAPARTW